MPGIELFNPSRFFENQRNDPIFTALWWMILIDLLGYGIAIGMLLASIYISLSYVTTITWEIFIEFLAFGIYVLYPLIFTLILM
jgi:hypothetical protein